MSTFRRVAFLRFALAAAVPLLFLFTAVMPSPATAGEIPVGTIRVTKDCSPDLTRPGSLVTCTIQFTNNGAMLRKVQWLDILAGGGLYPETTTTLVGPSDNRLNRQTYGPYLLDLPPMSTISVVVGITPYNSKSACKDPFYASLTNEVHVDPVGGGAHLATATTSFSVSCNAFSHT